MFLYTAVVSLFPYGDRRDEARSLYGGRYPGDILASYTALGYNAGTAEAIAKQFIHDLHVSPNEPPIQSGGHKQYKRFDCGTHFFDQVVVQGPRGDYALYCMNNDSNGIVLGYLEFIGECILQALTGPGKEELIAAKRVASLALVDGLNKWLHQSHENFHAIHGGPTEPHQLVVQSFTPDKDQRMDGIPAPVTIISDDLQGCHVASSPSFPHITEHPVSSTTLSEAGPAVTSSLSHPTCTFPLESHNIACAAHDHQPQTQVLSPYNQAPYDQNCESPRTFNQHSSNQSERSLEGAAHRRTGSCDTFSPLRNLTPSGTKWAFLRQNYHAYQSHSEPEPQLRSREMDMGKEITVSNSVGTRSQSYKCNAPHSFPPVTPVMATPVRSSSTVATTSSVRSTYQKSSVAERRLQRRKAEELVSSASVASGLNNFVPIATPMDHLSSSNSTAYGIEAAFSPKDQRPLSLGSQPRHSLGLLLPLDYSGMEDVKAVSEMNILSEIDSKVVNAIKTRLESNNSLDTVLDVLFQYRNDLVDLALPRPMAVDFDQALKDAKRETIFVNDNIFMGNAEKLMRRLQSLVLPLVGGKEENLASAVCKDIIRASSRTAGGGDAYSAVYSIFKQSNDGYMLAPKAAEGKPIIVVVDGERGEVCITVHNSLLLKHIPEDGIQCKVKENGSSTSSTEQEPRWKVKQWILTNFDNALARGGGGGGAGPKPDDCVGCSMRSTSSDLENGGEVTLDGCLTVHLSLLDGSCKRNLSVTSPLVEAASPQYIALGAGSSVVNGTFDLSGWRNGGPVYINASGVYIAIEEFEGRKGWIIGKMHHPSTTIYYGNSEEVDILRLPDLHWTFVAGGVGEGPPPTLMSSSVKPREIDFTLS